MNTMTLKHSLLEFLCIIYLTHVKNNSYISTMNFTTNHISQNSLLNIAAVIRLNPPRPV